MAKQKNKEQKEIVVKQLGPIEAVRLRPGMYVGSTERADILLSEIVGNSLDEIFLDESPADSVFIYTKDNGHYIVCDNGRGFPLQKAETNAKQTMAVLAVSSLHAGSKFNKSVGDNSKGGQNLIGLNGVGSSCVNFLSEKFSVFVKLNKKKLSGTTKKVEDLFQNSDIPIKDAWYYILFNKGELKEETIVNTTWIEEELNISLNNSITNIVSFIPDDTIYESREANLPSSLKFVKYISSFNNTKSHIYINDEEYLDSFNPFKLEFDAVLTSQKENAKNKEATFLCSMEIDKEDCENPVYVSSVNGLETISGVHVKLFDMAFDLAVGKHFGEEYVKYFKQGLKFSILCLCPEPSYNSQLKTHCSEIHGIDKKCIEPLSKKILKIFKDNKEDFDAHFERVKKIIASHKNLGKIEFIKEAIGGILADNPKMIGKLPRCVVDCTTKDRKKANLFIVEGNSAAGNLLACRDSRYDAVLMLRGKLLNTSDMDIKKALGNEEIRGIITALGVGVSEVFDTSVCRFNKIFLLTDADPDGEHICNLLLGLFGRHMRFLLKEKFVYILKTPLYKQGNKYFYAGEEHLMDPNKDAIHFKGLGEWNSKDFKEVCLGKNRKEILITPEDCDLALEYLSTTKKKNELMIEEKIIDV